LKSVKLPTLNIPGLPDFPAVEIVTLGVDNEHPYLALKFL
jgi:hypothetical protein